MSLSNEVLVFLKIEGYYSDSSGRVYSSSGKERKFNIDKSGYCRFTVNYYGKSQNVAVHRFVAYCKFGDRLFEEDKEVRHLDGNQLNNEWSNLDLGTHSENMMDRNGKDRCYHAKLAASYLRRLTEKQVADLRKDRLSGMSYKDLALKYNVAKSTICYIINNKTYK